MLGNPALLWMARNLLTASVAAEMAGKLGDYAIVLHIREWLTAGAAGWPARTVGPIDVEEPHEAAELVRVVLKKFEAEGATATAHVWTGMHGGVAGQILELAKKEGVGP